MKRSVSINRSTSIWLFHERSSTKNRKTNLEDETRKTRKVFLENKTRKPNEKTKKSEDEIAKESQAQLQRELSGRSLEFVFLFRKGTQLRGYTIERIHNWEFLNEKVQLIGENFDSVWDSAVGRTEDLIIQVHWINILFFIRFKLFKRPNIWKITDFLKINWFK